MNRTLLIVICDFLLLTLIATARLDQPPSVSASPSANFSLRAFTGDIQQAPAPPPPASVQNKRTSDLVEVMRGSLEEERSARDQLATTLAELQAALKSQEKLATDRQAQLDSARQNLLSKEEEAARAEKARAALASQFEETQSALGRIQERLAATSTEARLSQERLASVERQYASAQTNLVLMEKQLSSTDAEARLARERLAKIEADLRSRQDEADEARQRIEEVNRLRQAAELERERISGQLKVAETEQRLTREQLASAQGQITTAQQEKAELRKANTTLAENVGELAGKQGEIASKQSELVQEIRDNRPQTPNALFAAFLTNRVSTDFRADRSGILGRTVSKDSQARTILVTDGAQTFALYHVQDTPFRLEEFGKEWERFIVHLYRPGAILPLAQVLFLSFDPRVVIAPVAEAQARQLGVHSYRIVSEPYRFHDAFLVGADEGYYGECRFGIDPAAPGYLKMDRSMLGRFVGKFNPSRGDLVFAKSGEIIGLMVNKEYCALLSDLVPTAAIPTGPNLNAESVGAQLSRMDAALRRLPEPLR